MPLNNKAPIVPYACSLQMNEKADSNKYTSIFPSLLYDFKMKSRSINKRYLPEITT